MTEEVPLQLFWVSLDGLRRSDLEKYLNYVPNPHPKGFAYLLNKPNWNPLLQVTNPTITASAHISIITCTPPGRHGIVANRQWDGSRFVSGFNEPYQPENFVSTLKRAGLKVASLGYPSIDGRSDERSATVGAGYDNPQNRGRFISLRENEEFTVPLPSRTKADGQHEVKVRLADDRSHVVVMDGDDLIEIRPSEWKDIFFNHDKKKHLTVMTYFTQADGEVELYVSPTMINQSHPDSFRKALEKQNLVFSPGPDRSLRPRHGDEVFMKSMEHRLHYFTRVAKHIMTEEKPDAFFFYLEDLDVLGHQYEGDSSMDELRGAYFAKLDQAFGSVMELIPASANVVILGDHGMSAIKYEYNIQNLVSPAVNERLILNTSGGSFFAYGAKATLESNPPSSASWFHELVQSLRDAVVEFDDNRPVFNTVLVKGSEEARKMGLDGETMPWIMAFADPGISLKLSTDDVTLLARRASFSLSAELLKTYPDPLHDDILREPSPFGSHGHISSAKEMRTSLVMFGPLLDTVSAAAVEKSTSLVPAVADALELPRPNGCAIEN